MYHGFVNACREKSLFLPPCRSDEHSDKIHGAQIYQRDETVGTWISSPECGGESLAPGDMQRSGPASPVLAFIMLTFNQYSNPVCSQKFVCLTINRAFSHEFRVNCFHFAAIVPFSKTGQKESFRALATGLALRLTEICGAGKGQLVLLV